MKKNQHEWEVVFQCKDPYREFQYCPLCRQYQESGKHGYFKGKFMQALIITLHDSNPVYYPDSNEKVYKGR